jgi:G:T/U-mismatch repair DNA glycosylase
MKKHPFSPIIFQNSKSLLVGTLPPETTPFYFSNTPKTRLWDILYAIDKKEPKVPKNKYLLINEDKTHILENLSLSLTDIILQYDRIHMNSVKDEDIIPYAYQDIKSLIIGTEITQILFLYRNAAQWFLHSLENQKPAPINEIQYNIDSDIFYKFELNNKHISCKVLPMPLNRGRKGETMDYKLRIYKNLISEKEL